MESRTTPFESGQAETHDYTNELISNSGWVFEVGEKQTQGEYASISVTAVHKLDGRIHKMHYSVKPNLTKKVVDIYTSYTAIAGDIQKLTVLKDEFSFKSGIRYADVLPWVAATRERHNSVVKAEHSTGTPAKIGVSFFLPLVWDAFQEGRALQHERKSIAKDSKSDAQLFD